jgi:hypothetical protein
MYAGRELPPVVILPVVGIAHLMYLTKPEAPTFTATALA